MELGRFYKKIVEYGIKSDPRRIKTGIRSFADTAILHGDPGTRIKKILVGIDIDVSELLLADRIRSKAGLDAVLSHHPQGKAYASLPEVMQVQVDLFKKLGLSGEVAQQFLDERKREVERKILPSNHMRAVDCARLLDIPFLCAHTPADNHAAEFIQKYLTDKNPRKLEDIVSILNTLPEYKEAAGNNVGPRIILGSPKRHPGKILVEMTGGSSGPKDIYGKLSPLGVKTLVSMHIGEEHFRKVRDLNLNVIIAGHISSDTLGLNLLLDRIEKEEKFDIICCSGFRRFRRRG